MKSDTLNKLTGIGSDALAGETPALLGAVLQDCAPELAQEYVELLEAKNGFFAFEGALHVFPAGKSRAGYDLQDWNSVDGWVSAYGDAARGYFFFAEDIFGEQFAMRGSVICRFDPETARCEIFAGSIEEWASKILDDYFIETGFGLAHEWQLVNGPLEPTKRLVPKTPFILGGEYRSSNLFAVDAKKGMELRADIWRQIKDIPPGSKVEFQISDE